MVFVSYFKKITYIHVVPNIVGICVQKTAKQNCAKTVNLLHGCSLRKFNFGIYLFHRTI